MGWKEDLNQALLRFVQDYPDIDDAVEVTGFEQVMREMGMCDTCGYSAAFIEITYKTAAGRSKILEWRGDFGELMSKLTDERTE